MATRTLTIVRRLTARTKSRGLKGVLEHCRGGPSVSGTGGVTKVLYEDDRLPIVALLKRGVERTTSICPSESFNEGRGGCLRRLVRGTRQEGRRLRTRGIRALVCERRPFVCSYSSVSFRMCLVVIEGNM